MPAVRWFKVNVQEGSKTTPTVFYETDKRLFDLLYGWGIYTRTMHESLEKAMEDFRQHLQKEHDQAQDGIQVVLNQPIEISQDESKMYSPSYVEKQGTN